ncbi:serine protease, partial [Amylibacter sp.]|nr:serine protease [Amylibacter sp.]
MVNTLFVFSILMLLSLSAYARGAPESFADLAEELSPSVVNITTSTTIAGV